MSIIRQLSGNNFLWILKYRPNCIDDVILPKRIKDRFKSFVEKGQVPNLLFNGSPGIGKTTIAYALANELKSQTLYLNGSLHTSIDILRSEVIQFATAVSFEYNLKMVVLDEADRMSQQNQDAQKSLLETHSKNCSFIYITNHKERIIEPLKSRLEIIDFIFNKDDLKEMKKQFFKRAVDILKQENVKFKKENIIKLINVYFPDMRKCLGELQKRAETGELESDLIIESDNSIDTFIEVVKSKDYNKLNSYVANLSMDTQSWYVWLETNTKILLKEGMKPEYVGWFIITLHDYMYKSAFVADGSINIKAFILELMGIEGGLF